MNPRKIVKFAANLTVGLGAYAVTRQVIENNTPEPENRAEAVLQYAGSAAIGGIVADAASDHVDKKVDELFDTIEKYKKPTS